MTSSVISTDSAGHNHMMLQQNKDSEEDFLSMTEYAAECESAWNTDRKCLYKERENKFSLCFFQLATQRTEKCFSVPFFSTSLPFHLS
jgi:hypothetical protein